MNCNLRILHKIQRSADWYNLPHQFKNAVNIHTDSSKLNSKTGGGVFFPELDIKVSFRLPYHCSVFQAEVMAIQEAMSTLDTSEHHGKDIYIFSDSQAALRARNTLSEMATHLRINLNWVPGHQNIEDNCIASIA